MESLFEQYGYHVLDRTLMLCVSAWEGEPSSLSANMLKGVAKMVHTYGDALRDDQFIDRMSKIPLREIIRTAKERNAGSLGYAEAIFTFYNKKMKYPLQRHRLYDSNPLQGNEFMESGQEEADDISAEADLQIELT